MANSSGSKAIGYHIETEATVRLEQVLGDGLSRYSQKEKYQLSEAISGYLALMVLDKGNQKMCVGEIWTLIDYVNQYRPGFQGNVLVALFILKDESIEVLTELLPAIAEFARDHK